MVPPGTTEDGVLEVPAAQGLLANDTDADAAHLIGDRLIVVQVSSAPTGSLGTVENPGVVGSDGSFRCTPIRTLFRERQLRVPKQQWQVESCAELARLKTIRGDGVDSLAVPLLSEPGTASFSVLSSDDDAS